MRRCFELDPDPLCLEDQMLWEHDESHKKIKIHQNLFKYWFTFWHFAMDDPVADIFVHCYIS